MGKPTGRLFEWRIGLQIDIKSDSVSCRAVYCLNFAEGIVRQSSDADKILLQNIYFLFGLIRGA